MPLLNIHIVKGRSEDEIATLLQAVHDAMVEAFEVPVRDRYQVVTEHDPHRLILEDTGLGFERSDRRVLIHMTTRPRSQAMKEKFYALVVRHAGERCGIAPEDVMISAIENGDADWSFAHRRAILDWRPVNGAGTAGLPTRHLVLALSVVAIWGTNFVIVHMALGAFPPLLFAALRFACVFLPAAFLVRRPKLPWRTIAAYGTLLFAGQFGLMFYAMDGHISPGLASLVIQTQVFFTIMLAVLLGGESLRWPQMASLALATAGMALLVARADGSNTLLGLPLMVTAGFCWACGNYIARSSGTNEMLGLTIWSCLFATPLLFAAAALTEGSAAIKDAIGNAGANAWLAIAWQAIGNTLFGYGIWAWLLSRHPAATVAPLAMLVPIFGMGTAAIVLGDPLPLWKLGAAGLVLGGLVVNMVTSQWADRRIRREQILVSDRKLS